MKSATACGVDYTSSYPEKEIEITKEGRFIINCRKWNNRVL
tara:strand:+ start:1014 stop:1136 length:123 start_codon:yes stop_codon:yes gene_type:complete